VTTSEDTPRATHTASLGTIDLPSIVRYAGASGDFNPMHYDRDLAQKMGFDNNFAQGMFTAGLMSVIVAERYTPEALLGFGAKFVSPLWCGDAPTFIETVTDADTETGTVKLALEVRVDDRLIASGWARVATTT
jgi:acyl dehydratase